MMREAMQNRMANLRGQLCLESMHLQVECARRDRTPKRRSRPESALAAPYGA